MSENKLIAIFVVAVLLGGFGGSVAGIWGVAAAALVIAAIAWAPEARKNRE